MTNHEELREKVLKILREQLGLTCGHNCERMITQADEDVAYKDAADAILALLTEEGGLKGSSVAQSGGTASPKSDSAEGH